MHRFIETVGVGRGDFSSTDYTEALVLNGQRMTGLFDGGRNYSVICVHLCHLTVSLQQNVIKSVSSVLSQGIWINERAIAWACYIRQVHSLNVGNVG
ncbi:MAG: hypothetical protein RIE73_33300 [Coleofasciculus sp. C1-SOL-03]|uniref:hypothetical protein n=1 Tax=Coleofasciculus sp. C1-SOL-03 TaxID=3069522 RepID=UPI003305474B